MNKSQRFTFASGVLHQSFDEEALIVNLNTETVFSVNTTGAQIADLIAEETTVAKMIDILSNEYDISTTELEHEVYSFLRELLTRQMIVVIESNH